MCFIAINLNQNKQPAEHVASILDMKGVSNDDGMGILTIDGEKTNIIREIKYNPKKITSAVKKPFSLVHLRMATTGEPNIDNVHCYQIGDWIFAHNGTIGKFSGKGEKSDSLQFFENCVRLDLLDKIDIELIDNFADECSMHGRFIFTNTKTHMAYLFGDWSVVWYNDVLSILSTHVPLVRTENHHGFTFSEDFTEEDAPKNTDIEGIYELDIDTLQLFRIKNKTEYSMYHSYKNYNYPTKQRTIGFSPTVWKK